MGNEFKMSPKWVQNKFKSFPLSFIFNALTFDLSDKERKRF